MALASQTARLSEVGRTSFRSGRPRRRARLGPAILALAVVAGLGVLGWFWLADHAPKEAAAGDAATALRDPLNATFSTLPAGGAAGASNGAATPPVNPAPEPLSVINMGAVKNPQAQTNTGASPAIANRSDPTANPPQTTPAQQPANSPGAPGASPSAAAPSTAQNPNPAPPSAPPAANPAPAYVPASVTGAVSTAISDADRLVSANRLVEARTLLNGALASAAPNSSDAAALRDRLGRINETLVFSPAIAPGDTLSEVYAVQPGDSLVKIAANNSLAVDWRLIQRINKMADPRRLTVGQKLKLVRGPFHAVVSKADYRLDLYAGDPASQGDRVFIRSFRVGLGENNSTPLGSFVVRPQSKLINPTWANPRTGEFFAADNPKNPIGEHWIGLDPADAAAAAHTQYGIHGTIGPDSIGQQKSMGCVRLLPDDIALLYELLADRVSTVRIEP